MRKRRTSINYVASIGWIIKHHRNEILQDERFKENLIELIENCQLKNETSKDALALKSILKSILDDIVYKKQKNMDQNMKIMILKILENYIGLLIILM